MLRRRGGILMALGLMLAIASGGLVYYLLQYSVPASASSVMPTPTPVPAVAIPVAARELVAGTTITDTDIVEQDYPIDLLPVGVMTDTRELIGQAVVEPVAQGEFFRATQLSSDQTGPLSTQIGAGNVVLAFPVDDLLNRSKVINEGDRVDLLLTYEIKEETPTELREGKSTNFTLQNIKVVRVVRDRASEDNPNPEPKALLFEMSPQDAVIVKFVKDSGGTVDFTLRSSLQVEQHSTEAVTQDYLFDKYGFKAPRTSTQPKQQ